MESNDKAKHGSSPVPVPETVSAPTTLPSPSPEAQSFLNSMLSATQNAVTSLAGLKHDHNGDGSHHSLLHHGRNHHHDRANRPRSFSDPTVDFGSDTDLATNANGDHHTEAAVVSFTPLRSTVSTLGRGELSLESLGYTPGAADNSSNKHGRRKKGDANDGDESSSGGGDNVRLPSPAASSLANSASLPGLSSPDNQLRPGPDIRRNTIAMGSLRLPEDGDDAEEIASNDPPDTPAQPHRDDESAFTVPLGASTPITGTLGSQTSEFHQGGTIAVPTMSRHKSGASSLIRHRHRRSHSSEEKEKSSKVKEKRANGGADDDNSSGNSAPLLTGFAYANKKRNHDFHRLFRSVLSDDYLLDDFSCALSREILLHGRLYVSERHLCFNSNILGWVTNLVIGFDEIVSLEKKSTAGLFPNGIAVQTLHARHSFASFVARDSTLEFLIAVWKQVSPHQPRVDANGNAARTQAFDSDNLTDDEAADDEEPEEGDQDQESYDDDQGSFSSEDEDERALRDREGVELGQFGSSEEDFSGAEDESFASPVANGRSSRAGTTSQPAVSRHGSVKKTGGGGGDDLKWPVANLGPETHAPTDSGYSPESNGEKILARETIPAPLGVVANLLFGEDPTFMRKYQTERAKNINFSALPPFALEEDESGVKKKTRHYDYVKPLNGPVGPKQTRCICRDSVEEWDLDKCIQVITQTSTPDVPSGNSFVVKTRYQLTWAAGNITLLTLSYCMQWSAKSWLKGPIEKGSHDGQMEFATTIVDQLRTAVKTKGRKSRAPSRAGAGAKKSTGHRNSRATKIPAASSQSVSVSASSSAGGLQIPFTRITLGNSTVGSLLLLLVVLNLWMLLFRGPPTVVTVDPLKAMEIQEEYDIWQWIDRRGTSNDNVMGKPPGHSDNHNVQYARQNLQESVRISQQRLDMLKQRLADV